MKDLKHIKTYDNFKKLKESKDTIKKDGRFVFFDDKIKLAGNSKYPVGTKIKIKKLKGDDADLSGLTGELTHPFGFSKGDVGVYLDKKGVYKDDKVNLKNNEFTVEDDEALELLKKHETINESIEETDDFDHNGINYQSDFTEEEKSYIQDHVEERIAEMVEDGFTSGELLGEEPRFNGWWKVNIEIDDEDEDIRNKEIAKNIRNGNTSGFNPIYQWSANVCK